VAGNLTKRSEQLSVPLETKMATA